jgi:hypothetical protein
MITSFIKHDFQPVQSPEMVAGDEVIAGKYGQASDGGVDPEARNLAPFRYVPQPDRVVVGARGEASVGQHAQRMCTNDRED